MIVEPQGLNEMQKDLYERGCTAKEELRELAKNRLTEGTKIWGLTGKGGVVLTGSWQLHTCEVEGA